MGSIRRSKTKRRTRDLDQIHADLRSTKHLTQFKNTKAAEDLPGLGRHYCIECAKWFEGEYNFQAHRRGKNHKRRVRLLKEDPYTQKEAEAAAGLQPADGKDITSEVEADAGITAREEPANLGMDTSLQKLSQNPSYYLRKIKIGDHYRDRKKAVLYFEMETHFVTRELFGGAASVDVPSDYYDVSSLRQVPDHQEVYQEKDGFDHVIIEIMEHVPNVTSVAAARFHLEDYADTDGRELKIWQTEEVQMPHLPPNTPVVAMFATTPAPQPGKNVGIFLLTIRLPEHDTDLLVTMNVKNASTNAATDYQALFAEGGDQGLAKGKGVIQRIISSFEMKDYSLFHPED